MTEFYKLCKACKGGKQVMQTGMMGYKDCETCKGLGKIKCDSAKDIYITTPEQDAVAHKVKFVEKETATPESTKEIEKPKPKRKYKLKKRKKK
jgi:hypothetical protein